ncbi:hypothetical protein BJY52DRAFT_1228105 [Lactarius psammicola]|nr:hypothetical protein BJY52DRAFT_1228105 [Lactarius psammicola]
MPALIPVHNTLGALFIGTVLSSMLLDTANLGFIIYATYHIGITNFGDYQYNPLKNWQQLYLPVRQSVLTNFCPQFSSMCNQLFLKFLYSRSIVTYFGPFGAGNYSYEQSVISLTEFGIEVGLILDFSVQYKSVLCDVLITFGMVYTLLSNHTQVRRTNNVLNLLAIYVINCGTLHFIDSLNEACQVSRCAHTCTVPLHHDSTLSLRIHVHSSDPRHSNSVLNSRDNLRETLDGPEGVVTTLTQLEVRTGTTVPWGVQDIAEENTNTAVPKSRPPLSIFSNISLSDSVITFDREKYAVPPVPEFVKL